MFAEVAEKKQLSFLETQKRPELKSRTCGCIRPQSGVSEPRYYVTCSCSLRLPVRRDER